MFPWWEDVNVRVFKKCSVCSAEKFTSCDTPRATVGGRRQVVHRASIGFKLHCGPCEARPGGRAGNSPLKTDVFQISSTGVQINGLLRKACYFPLFFQKVYISLLRAEIVRLSLNSAFHQVQRGRPGKLLKVQLKTVVWLSHCNMIHLQK